MNETQLRKLQALDLDYGDGIFSKIKPSHNDDITLVIGLGGMGCRTVDCLKREVSKHMEKTERVYYLAVDSDMRELDNLTDRQNGILTPDEVFCIFHPSAAYMNVLPTQMQKWINPSLQIRIDGNGSGGIRQQGRYLITHPEISASLREKLSEILISIKDKFAIDLACGSAVDVVVATGIGGGTGSGIFIDMAYLVRDVLDAEGLGKYCSFTGYIYMPDTQSEISSYHGHYIERNGYAALKELDYFMSIKETGGVYEWPFDDTSRKIYHNVYDRCVLIGGRAEIRHRTWKQCILIAARNIFNEITGFKTDFGLSNFLRDMRDYNGATVRDFLANLVTYRSAFSHFGNYKYSVNKFSEVKLPLDGIANYVGYKLLTEAKKSLEVTDVIEERIIDIFMASTGLKNVESLIEIIKNAASLEIWFDPDDRVLKPNDENLMREIHIAVLKGQHAMGIAERHMDSIEENVTKHIIYEASVCLEQMLIQKGPYYISRAIINKEKEDNGIDIRTMLQKLIRDLETYGMQCAHRYGDMYPLEYALNSKSECIRRDLLRRVVYPIEADNYKDTVRSTLSKAVFDKELCRVAVRVVQRIADWLNNYYRDICETYIGVIECASDMLHKNACGLSENVEKTLDSIIETAYKDKFIALFKRELCNLSNCDAFTSKGEEFNAAEKIKDIFNNVLYDFYQNLSNITLILCCNSYEGMTAKELKDCMNNPVKYESAMQNAAHEIVQEIIRCSECTCKLEMGLTPFPLRSCVIIPKNLPEAFISAFEREIRNNVYNARFLHCEGYTPKLIEMVNIVPLFNVKQWLKEYEHEYTSAVENGAVGLHLNEARGCNWAHYLPNIFPSEMWEVYAKGYTNNLTLSYEERTKKLADDALSRGLIYTNEGEYYMYGIGRIVYYGDIFEPLETYPEEAVEQLRQRVAEAVRGGEAGVRTGQLVLDTIKSEGETCGLPVVSACLSIRQNILTDADNDKDKTVLYTIMRKRARYAVFLDKFIKLYDELEKTASDITAAK